MSFTFHSALRKLNRQNLLQVLPTKVRLIWLSSFRRRVLEIGQSEIRIVCGDHVGQRIGMKCAIFIEELPQLLPTKFRFIWLSSLREDFYKIGQLETRIVWRPCLLTNRDEMSNLNRRPSIVASYQVSVHLAKQFQRRRFFLICQSETRIACGDHVC